MANILVPRFGDFGPDYASQLSVSGSSDRSLGLDLSYVSAPIYSSDYVSSDLGTTVVGPAAQPWYSGVNWGSIATTAISTAGSTVAAVLGHPATVVGSPYGTALPGVSGTGPVGSTFGSIDSKVLLLAAVAVVAILAFSGKKSA